MGHDRHTKDTTSEPPPVLAAKRPNAFARIPGGRFGLLGVLTLLLLLAALACSEVFWRVQGFRPSVTDGEDLWCAERARVEGAGRRLAVVLGRSRIQQAFVPAVFEKAAPGYAAVQLAVGGQHPIAALRDLAENTDFAGVVICSITAPSLLPELWDQQAGYVAYYHEAWGPLAHLSRAIKTFAQWHLALLAPELTLQEVLPGLARRDVQPQFLRVTPRRHHVVDYRKAPLEQFRADQLQTIKSHMARYVTLEGYLRWPAGVQRVEDIVRRITGRGGKVVFVRLPTSGEYRETEERAFPREKYWDVWAAATSAETLHFEDVPAMAAMECAEGTHLHIEDTGRFTRLFAEELRARGVLTP
jgi:hypothetical protein